MCHSVEEFIAAVDVEESIDLNAIRVSITSHQENEAKAEVFFHAGALTSRYTIEFGASCGMDYADGEGDLEGSLTAANYMSSLEQYASQKGLRILPGIIQE